jgi:2-polyprenyl-6-methoxyphenol hydroxylase-like FAD-dependent oxidoreductase
MVRKLTNEHFLSGKSIIVAGAGVAGLSFAIAITKFWNEAIHGAPPSLQIFERDTQENAIGREGYSLSLRTDSGAQGIQTLQKLGILDEMIEVSITGLDHKGSFAIWDKNWKPVMKIGARLPEGLSVGSMRIARNKMRKVLVDAFLGCSSAGMDIEWGRWCTGISETGDGTMRVQISDGKVIECDVLIAADGASSKLRSGIQPEEKLQFAGVSAITATSRWEGQPPSPVDKDWGIVLSGKGTALFASPVDHHSAVWSLSWREPQPRQGIKFPRDESSIQELIAEAKEKGSWLPSLWDDMLQRTDTGTLWLMNAMDKPAFDHASAHRKAVVFIGDANHAVSPFAGAGANLALMDGLDLATSLLDAPSFEEAIKVYDAKAVPRAKRILSMSHFTISVAHSKGWMSWAYLWVLRILYWLFMRKYVEMKEGEKN